MYSKRLISFAQYLFTAVLNSYGMLFFSRNKVLSLLIMCVSFMTPFAGLSGLTALLIALITAHALGFSRDQVQNGLITYSVVLFGLGYGTNFEFGLAFCMLLVVGSLLTLFLSVALNSLLNKRGLPALSLAFIISTWVIILASKSFTGIGITQRYIYWFNEAYALGGTRLVNLIQEIENWKLPDFVAGFFRSMSAILFQVNIASGLIMSIGLLIYSRIAFSLMVLGYSVAILFSMAMGGFSHIDMTYYNMGTNFMLVAVALGGFYVIPNTRSYLWTLITVPLAYLLVVASGLILFRIGVPSFSMPFCLVVILFIHVLQLRSKSASLVLTPVQYYSPEQNLYRYSSGKDRLFNQLYWNISLPVMGEWMVSQGHDSTMTHRGDWSKALDFVLLDSEMKTYQHPGTDLSHFHCYGKPVICPADGTVVELIDYIEDNPVGGNNAQQNWGNTLIIKHAEGLYSKLSHLRKNSIKTSLGAFVRKGDLIAVVGNSGRSPEPHLHFQLQRTPYVGSKTLAYPIAYFTERKASEQQLKSYSIPQEGSFVGNIIPDPHLKQAFNFQPGFCLNITADGFNPETWECMTSYSNETYLYCRELDAYAYFLNDGTLFRFTNYFGTRSGLLYQFYLAAYSILLSTEKTLPVQDQFPVNQLKNTPQRWIQDLLAPFVIFLKMDYYSVVSGESTLLGSGSVQCVSTISSPRFMQSKKIQQFSIQVAQSAIRSFTFTHNNQTITAICSPAN